MNLVILAALIAVCGAAKLDRAYLPPPSANTAGGAPDDLETPIAKSSQNALSSNDLPKGSYTNDFEGVVVDASAAGTRAAGPGESGLGGPRSSYGSTASKVGDAAFRQAPNAAFRNQQQFVPQQHSNELSFNEPSNPANDRAQAAQDRVANTIRFDSEVGPEAFNYAFETDNGISAQENGVATNGVQAQGGFSYTSDDGQKISVEYTADENGYQPKGDHLPTPPPIPPEILESLEQNARAEAAGIVDDGTYDAQKYNVGSDYNESDNNDQFNGRPLSKGTGNGATDINSSGSFVSQNVQPFARLQNGESNEQSPQSLNGQFGNAESTQFGQRPGSQPGSSNNQQSGQFNNFGNNGPQGHNQGNRFGVNEYLPPSHINSQNGNNNQPGQPQSISNSGASFVPQRLISPPEYKNNNKYPQDQNQGQISSRVPNVPSSTPYPSQFQSSPQSQSGLQSNQYSLVQNQGKYSSRVPNVPSSTPYPSQFQTSPQSQNGLGSNQFSHGQNQEQYSSRVPNVPSSTPYPSQFQSSPHSQAGLQINQYSQMQNQGQYSSRVPNIPSSTSYPSQFQSSPQSQNGFEHPNPQSNNASPQAPSYQQNQVGPRPNSSPSHSTNSFTQASIGQKPQAYTQQSQFNQNSPNNFGQNPSQSASAFASFSPQPSQSQPSPVTEQSYAQQTEVPSPGPQQNIQPNRQQYPQQNRYNQNQPSSAQYPSNTPRPSFGQNTQQQNPDDSYIYNQPSQPFNAPENQPQRFSSSASSQFGSQPSNFGHSSNPQNVPSGLNNQYRGQSSGSIQNNHPQGNPSEMPSSTPYQFGSINPDSQQNSAQHGSLWPNLGSTRYPRPPTLAPASPTSSVKTERPPSFQGNYNGITLATVTPYTSGVPSSNFNQPQYQPNQSTQVQQTASPQIYSQQSTAGPSDQNGQHPQEPEQVNQDFGQSQTIQPYQGEVYQYDKPSEVPSSSQVQSQGSEQSPENSESENLGQHSQSPVASNAQFGQTSSSLAPSLASSQGKGEVFGGPRQPPKFDEQTGYHY